MRVLSASIILFVFLAALFPSFAHLPGPDHVEFVNISDNGFSSDFIAIRAGSTVVWTSVGGSHWPASDFHPVHEGYPEAGGCIGSKLDACRGLKNGENFTFTFSKPGKWGMHDHLHSGFTMTVEVTGAEHESVFTKIYDSVISKLLSFLGFNGRKNIVYDTPVLSAREYANQSAAWCRKYSEKYKIVETAECYATQMENLSFLFGRNFAYDVLFELQKIDNTAKTCHFIAHGIGWGLYKKNPEGWQKLLAESRNECTYGEQMGVIEYYTQTLPEGKLTKEYVPELCGEAPKANCNHAVGHMILLETENNISKAIDLCHGIADEKQIYHCLTGMFMERVAATNLAEHGMVPNDWTYSTMWKRINESESLCRSYTGQESVACWREMAHPIAQFYKSDPKKTFDRCNTAPAADAAMACKSHALHDLASPKRFNLTVLRPMCGLDTDPKFESYCYSALVNIKINSLRPSEFLDVTDFCSSLEPGYRKDCFSSIVRSLRNIRISREEQKNLCGRLPVDYKSQCASGAGGGDFNDLPDN